MLGLFEELKERRVFRFVAAYLAGGWILLQVVDQLADRSILPEMAYRGTLVFVLSLFPAALILSWFHGAKGAQRVSGLERVLLLIVVSLAVGATWSVTRTDTVVEANAGALSALNDPRRVAVLYFDHRGSDDAGLIASGLTEALIDELSAIDLLTVISRNGVAPFRAGATSADSIGAALSVGSIVEGTVQASDDRIRVDVSLVHASTGAQEASTRLDRPRTELFELQDDLAREVSLFLREAIGEEIGLIERRAATNSVDAWTAVQRYEEAAEDADLLADAGDLDGASKRLIRADSILAEAEDLDPGWTEPTVARGWLAYRQSRLRGFDRAFYSTWIERGMEHAERALAKNSEDPDALELRGTLSYWSYLLNLAGDSDETTAALTRAEADLRRSAQLDRQQAGALSSLSHLLMNRGATAEAKVAAMRSYEADPYLQSANLTLWRLFTASMDLQDRVEAERWCDVGARRFPEEGRFKICKVRVMAFPGAEPDIEQAWRLHREFVELSPPGFEEFDDHEGRMWVAMALARAGAADSARAVARAARASTALDPVHELSYLESIVRTWVGDHDEAVDLLSLYMAANPAASVEDLGWWWDDLKEHPRFKQLVASG